MGVCATECKKKKKKTYFFIFCGDFVFIGTYEHIVDSKGRVIIPAKFREELGEVFYATKGKDKTVMIISKETWEKLEADISLKPSATVVKLKRFFFSSAVELIPDKQGRVLLSQALRDYAGLEKDVVINGAGSQVEIWNAAKWKEYNDDLSDEEVYDIMASLDL